MKTTYLWGMDTNIYTPTICLLTLSPFNINNKLLSVYLYNFSNLLSFIMSTNNLEEFHLEIEILERCYRITCTSSSFLMGIVLTLYFCLSSLERGADISFLRTWEGAVKCLFLFLLREAVTNLLNFMLGTALDTFYKQWGYIYGTNHSWLKLNEYTKKYDQRI